MTTNVVFQPVCTNGHIAIYNGSDPTVVDALAPFYSSSVPLVFVIGATTVIAWSLIIVLLITPAGLMDRSSRGFSSFFQSRHMPGRPAIRSRPWLQKAAALLVAIAMTIATVHIFSVAEEQYSDATIDAAVLRDKVAGSLEVRIIRVISDVFLWLAQVQTLIRLFPRHKEKLIIKWFGFLLILLDLIFSCLNSFYVNSLARPRAYQDAIPALAYLFQLSLGLLYAAWVFFYATTKRRYAFFHPSMPNISIIAALSTVSILIPVVFFIVDVAEPNVAGWGDYFRWVGAAAASIIVWEWVDRIELLEQDEKKDGILGREVFDGDEMLATTPISGNTYSEKARRESKSSRTDSTDQDTFFDRARSKLSRVLFSPRAAADEEIRIDTPNKSFFKKVLPMRASGATDAAATKSGRTDVEEILGDEATPIDDAASDITTDTTLYVVRYHTVTATPPLLKEADDSSPKHGVIKANTSHSAQPESVASRQHFSASLSQFARPVRNFATNTFKRRRASPPLEVKRAMSHVGVGEVGPARQPTRWTGTRQRLGAIAADRQARQRKRKESLPDLEPTVIPAPPRGQTWSPDVMRHSPTPRPRDEVGNRTDTPQQAVQDMVRLSDTTAADSGEAPLRVDTSSTRPISRTLAGSVSPPQRPPAVDGGVRSDGIHDVSSPRPDVSETHSTNHGHGC